MKFWVKFEKLQPHSLGLFIFRGTVHFFAHEMSSAKQNTGRQYAGKLDPECFPTNLIQTSALFASNQKGILFRSVQNKSAAKKRQRLRRHGEPEALREWM